ncbi:glycosyltransferase [Polaromonas aquatica]|uniref:glycosyltransferase n=1 Tax=Polaromonas aquatica TaxID=332657 RepID=UPI003D65C566
MNNDSFDAVYFLMFPGWENEMRSNRWHFISRWARHAPVVLIQPTQNFPSPRPDSTPERRIPGARVLKIQSLRASPFFDASTQLDIQLAQVERDMEQHQVRRPLLWAYNPGLSDLYARLPAAYRVFHATEDYFRFSGPERGLIPQLIFSIDLSDLVVAVSSGVASSIATHAAARRVTIETNGCDFDFYADPKVRQHPIKLAQLDRRVAIYAGNVNARLDFALILRACVSLPETHFVLFGPLADLSGHDLKSWKQLLATPNFRYLGAATPEQLRNLYAGADLGIIPYLATPMIKESGFPLKALEMGASGLPVVSTLMKPLQGLADAIVVTSTAEQFIDAVRHLDRASMNPRQVQELIGVAQREGYDNKFARIRATIAEDLAQLADRGLTPAPDDAWRQHIATLLGRKSQRWHWFFEPYSLMISAYRALRDLRSRVRMGAGKTFNPTDLGS